MPRTESKISSIRQQFRCGHHTGHLQVSSWWATRGQLFGRIWIHLQFTIRPEADTKWIFGTAIFKSFYISLCFPTPCDLNIWRIPFKDCKKRCLNAFWTCAPTIYIPLSSLIIPVLRAISAFITFWSHQIQRIFHKQHPTNSCSKLCIFVSHAIATHLIPML